MLISPLGPTDAMRYGHLHLAENHEEMIMFSMEKIREEFVSEVKPEMLTVAARRP
jgi:hypothetical protein